MWVAFSSHFLRFALQFGACGPHSRDQLIDIRCLHEVAAIPPERQCMTIESSRAVKIVQWSLMWFGQAEHTAAAVSALHANWRG
jgi:hypothetical protein